MTRYAIDNATVLRLLEENVTPHARHQLVAPAVVRSEVLATLFAAVRSGTLSEKEARLRLERLAELKMRLLGDRVSRVTAWKIAMDAGWPQIGLAEYLAVAVLQSDALVTEDGRLVAAAAHRIPIARYDDLFA